MNIRADVTMAARALRLYMHAFLADPIRVMRTSPKWSLLP